MKLKNKIIYSIFGLILGLAFLVPQIPTVSAQRFEGGPPVSSTKSPCYSALKQEGNFFTDRTKIAQGESFKIQGYIYIDPTKLDSCRSSQDILIKFEIWDTNSSVYSTNNLVYSSDALASYGEENGVGYMIATHTFANPLKDLPGKIWAYVQARDKVSNSGIKLKPDSGQELIIEGTTPFNEITQQISAADSTVVASYQRPSEGGDEGGNNGCAKFVSGAIELALKDPDQVKLFYKNPIGFNLKYTIPEQFREECSQASAYQKVKIDIWVKVDGHTVAGTVGEGNFWEGKDLLLSGLTVSPVKEGEVVVGFEAGSILAYPTILRPADIKKFEDDPNATINSNIEVYLRNVDRIGLVYNSYGQRVAEKAVLLVGDETKQSVVDESFKQVETKISGPQQDAAEKVAVTIADFIAQVIGTIMWFVVGIIYNIFSFVIAPLIEISLAIHTYTDDFAKVILPGWELLRNLSNIFFIVILLAIGLATLFRVQKYQYRNLLLKLILAALLVNFSLVITQSVLAIAETVQSQFLPIEKNDDVIRTIAKSIMFAPFEQGTITPDVASKSLSESLSRLVFPFFYLALSIMGFIVMGSLAILLIVRLAAIWILLMTSPIAFVAWVLPATSKYTDKWLDNLFRYGFFVAVIGFFLNVVAFLAQRQGGVFQDLTDAQVTGWDGFLSRIATNLMILIFMIVAMGTASSLKIKGAKFAQKAAAFPLDWLRTNLGARSAKLQSQGGWKGALGKAGLIATNPDAYYKAGIQRWTDTKKKQTDRIEAGAYDLSRGVFRGKKTNRLQELREKEIAELDKTNPYFNGDQALREFNKIKGKGYDSQVAREFWMRKMMENKDFGKLLKDKNLPDNLDGMLGLINQLANSGEIDKEASAYLVDVLTGSAKKNKNEKFVAGNKDKDGKAALIQGNMVGDIFVPATEEDIAAYDKVKEARKKRFNKTSDNDKVQGITPDSPFIELPNGQTTIDVYGAMLVANANDSYLTKAGRDMDPGQTKNFGKLLENGEQIDKSVQKVADILREQDKENGIKHDNSPEDQEEVMGRAKTKFREYSRWAHNIELEEDMRTYRKIYPTQTNAFEKRSFKDDPEYIGEHAKMEDKTQRQLEKAINVAFSKPGTYRDTFTEDIARKIRSTPGFGTPGGVNLPKMEEKVRTQMGQMFADRFVPKDLGLKDIPSTQVASTKREIQNIITNVSRQNRPGTNVTDDEYRALPLKDDLKRQEIFRRVTEHIAGQHFSGDPQAATKATKVANQILGDIK